MNDTYQSLNGLRVLNTRPKQQGTALSQAIQESGGVAIDLPALTIFPYQNWITDLPPLTNVHQALFISVNAVKIFFQQLNDSKISWPAAINLIAVGHATAAALKESGFHPVSTPKTADSEGLLSLPCLQTIKNQTILHVKGTGGRSLIRETIEARDAKLISINVYHRDMPAISHRDTDFLWQENAVDIILFTSEQAIHNVFNLFSEKGQEWLKEKPCLVISKRLVKVAFEKGMQRIISCNYDGIIHALCDYQNSCHSFSDR